MKKNKLPFTLLVLAVIMIANSLSIFWNDFISDQSTTVFYSYTDGKQVVLKYDDKNNPEVFFIYQKIIGYSENNQAIIDTSYERIYRYNGRKFIIPPKLKIVWVSDNEIKLIAANSSSSNINETIFLSL